MAPAPMTENDVSPNVSHTSAEVQRHVDHSLVLARTEYLTNNRSTVSQKRKRDEEYVRQPYIRRPYISVAPMKIISEPREAAGHVRRREDRKVMAMPPPITKSNTSISKATDDKGDGEGEDKPQDGHDNRNNGEDDDGREGGEEQAELRDEVDIEESEDEFESATSTPWPEDTWNETSSPVREIIPVDENSISKLHLELAWLEEVPRLEREREQIRKYRVEHNMESCPFIRGYPNNVLPIYCLFAEGSRVWRFRLRTFYPYSTYHGTTESGRLIDTKGFTCILVQELVEELVDETELRKAGWLRTADGACWRTLASLVTGPQPAGPFDGSQSLSHSDNPHWIEMQLLSDSKAKMVPVVSSNAAAFVGWTFEGLND